MILIGGVVVKARTKKKQQLATAKAFELEKILRAKEIIVYRPPTLQEAWDRVAVFLKDKPGFAFYIDKDEENNSYKLTDINDKVLLEANI